MKEQHFTKYELDIVVAEGYSVTLEEIGSYLLSALQFLKTKEAGKNPQIFTLQVK